MSDELVTLYYRVVSSNTSRRIIYLLGEGKAYRATELIEALQVSPGTFYDALKRLKGIVEKTEDGKYRLTQVGKKLYYILIDESKGFDSSPSSLAKTISSLPFIFPLRIFKSLDDLNSVLSIAIIAGIFSISLPGILLSRLIPVTLFLIPPYVNLNLLTHAILFSANFIFFISLAYFLSNVFGKVNNSLKLCASIVISYIPQSIFSYLYYFFYHSFFQNINFIYYLIIFLIPLFFSFTMLTTSIFSQAMLRIETSFIVSLTVLLVSFLASNLMLNILLGI